MNLGENELFYNLPKAPTKSNNFLASTSQASSSGFIPGFALDAIYKPTVRGYIEKNF